MSIPVKISSLSQPVAVGIENEIGGTLQLTEGSNIALGISPEAIAGYFRENGDLVIRMTNGETLRIVDFYAQGHPPSQLYLVDAENELVLVEFGVVSSEGTVAASYVPQDVAAGFESLTATGVTAANSGLGTTGMLVLGGLAAGAAVAASSGGGGGGNDAPLPVQPEQAVQPSELALSANGRTITGRAAPGSTVELDIDGNGVADATALVAANGQFTITVAEPLDNGEKLQLRTRLSSGKLSEPATLSAPDYTPPSKPDDLQITSDGSQMSGKAEPGSTISVMINGVAQPGVSVVINSSGQFTVSFTPPVANGETITVVAIDAAGNSSVGSTLTAADTTAPSAPSNLNLSADGLVLSGQAETGSTVGVTINGVGLPSLSVVATPDGEFVITFDKPLNDGDAVRVVATDAAGNSSPGASLTVGDTTAPLPPSDLSLSADGLILSGQAEPGSLVSIIVNGVAQPALSVIAGPDGHFAITFGAPLNNGQTITAIATDAAGNSSAGASLTATDTTAPSAPNDLSLSADGLVFSGQAEPGSTVSIAIDGVTQPGFSVLVGQDGQFAIDFNSPLENGQNITANATDVAGNSSADASLTAADTTAPLAPSNLVLSTDGLVLSGNAEPGSTVSFAINGVDQPALSVVAGADGQFAISFATPFRDGETITAVSTDAAGNSSPGTSLTVADTTAPAPPSNLSLSADGLILSGQAEPGSLVNLSVDGVGQPALSIIAGSDGQFAINFSSPLNNGQTITVIASDGAGNSSTGTSLTAADTAAPVPPSNLSLSADGLVLSGQAEPGSTVSITIDGVPQPGLSLVVGQNGQFAITFATPQDDGQIITAVATDAANNSSPGTSLTAPDDPPAPNITLSSDGRVVAGHGDPGNTVELDINGDGVPDYTTLVGPDGRFSIMVLQALHNGELLQLRIRLADGTLSSQTTLQAPDDLAPLRPSALQVAADGSQISGRAEPGSTVSIDTNGDGVADASVLVGPSGQFVILISPALDNGQTITVTATDAAGNASVNASVLAPDTTPPATPVLNATNGRVITGTAEIGASVVIVVVGNTAVTVPVDANGNWTYTPNSPIADGTTVTVTARDTAGNSSPPVSVDVTAALPNPPVIIVANGTEISGTGPANTLIEVRDSNGTLNAPAVPVGSDGTWMTVPAGAIGDTTITVTAVNAQNQQSAPTITSLDVTPPSVSVITHTTTLLGGTGEPGSTVQISVGGSSLGQLQVDAQGNWSFLLSPALPDGAQAAVTARDSAGNVSASVVTTIDGQPPSAPVVTASSESAISGTAEPGSLLRLVNDSGRTLGEFTVDPSGVWSFTPSPPLAEGTEVTVTARDEAGNNSPSTTVRIDSIAPDAVNVDASNGTVFTGNAEPGSTVIITGPGGAPIGQSNADINGDWTITPSPALADGDQVSVVVRDTAGNSSTPVTVTVDLTPPPAPEILPTNGGEISGTAEPGSTVTITTGGTPLTAITDATGHWSVAAIPALPNGTVISAIATDAAGNPSQPSADVTTDNSLPDRPTIEPSNGSTLSGTAVFGESVILTDGNGSPIATVLVASDNTWTYTPTPALADSTQVIAVAQDGSGNLSAPINVVVDALPPPAAQISPSNGWQLSGTAEANSTVLISGAGITAQVVAGPDGKWSYNAGPGLPIADGTNVTVTVRDASGNISPPSSVLIDAAPPAVPSIAPSNGTVLTGTAEPGSQVILSTPGGLLATVNVDVDVNGNWSYTPLQPLANNVVVSAVARDAVGNISPGTTTSIDALPPGAPTVSPSNGSVISGTGQPDATITLTDASGTVIGTVPVVAGTWSFTPSPALPDGTLIKATATDAVGNLGPATTITVDGIAPDAPVINPSTGTTLSGTAEPFSTIRLVDGNDNPIGATTTNSFGNWTFLVTPTPLPDGTVVNAVATDAAGNVSLPASTTTDSDAPDLAIITAYNGSEIAGTAEIGSTVRLTLPGGRVVDVPVDGTGNWSYAPNPPLANGNGVDVYVRDTAGNSAGPVNVVIDAVPPAAPVVDASNGTLLEGTTEPGSVILITIGNGTPIVITPAPGGAWSYTPTPPLAEGDTVTVVAQDAAGNIGTPTNPVIDTTPPDVTIEPSNGSVLTGLTEPGASVAVSVNGSVVATVTANSDGRWTWSPAPGSNVPNNTVISVVASDPAGNPSTPATGAVDSQAPSISIDPSNGRSLSGQTEGLATVTITSAGAFIANVTAAGDGTWTYTPVVPLAHNASISVSARDAVGNGSGGASTIVDAQAPAAPTITPGNGSVVSGTAELGSTVTLTLTAPGPGGAVTTIGPITVDNLGNWTYPASPAIAHDTTITATASDALGNTSPASAGSVVDSVPPASPIVLPSDGTSFTGTAEPGSTITFEVDGVPLGTPPLTVTADANGYWQLNGVGPFPDGAQIEATATDAAGNASLLPGNQTVDASLPATPVINPSRGNIITGTAEPGTTVTLTIGAQVFSGIVVSGSGIWSHFPNPPLGDGQQVTAVAVDGASNSSSPATIVIDAMPPAVPVALTGNSTTVTGTGEIGAEILIRFGATVLGTAIVGADGKWTVTFSPAQPHGTLLTATARDALGNSSNFDVIAVDAIGPGLPNIAPSNGTTISGTAEANGTVIITAGGIQIGTALVAGNGSWTFTASPPIADGTLIEVVARDPNGNVGPAAGIIVDGTPPQAPTVDATNGSQLSGTAEPNGTITLVVDGSQIGQIPVDGGGNWSFVPSPRLADGTQVEVIARDPAGNASSPTTVIVDAMPPAAPTVNPSNGVSVSGTAEPGSQVTVFDNQNGVVGQVTADPITGIWSIAPGVVPPHGAQLTVVATDGASNDSTATNITVDRQAPNAPTARISSDGTLLTGTAEANSKLSVLIAGSGTPIVVTVDGNGAFTVPLSPALTVGQVVQIVATDAAGNSSTQVNVPAPNLTPPTLALAEPADGYINAAEISNGIQVQVNLQPGMRAGDNVTLTFHGQGGFTFTHTHMVNATEVANGSFAVTLTPSGGNGTYPQGMSNITLQTNNGAESPPASFIIDTIAPTTPVLSLAGSLLTISSDPGTLLSISVNIGGVTAVQTLTANNAGIASLNLLTGLSIGLTWDQLLSAQINVSARDTAGNPSNVVQIGLGAGTNLQPVTVGNFSVDASLNPLAPKLGISGTTAANAGLVIAVISPLLNITLSPMVANASGQFSLNLLSPSVLSQLGLTVGGLLNLGQDLQIRITSTSQGKQSATYTVDLDPLGLLGLTIGAVTVTGTAADDILSGVAASAERIVGGLGNDLILNVGSNDRVEAGGGNDTIQITASNFAQIDGGAGFDTLLLAGGIDINFSSIPLGTLTSIERFDLGTGDAGSTITLTAAQVDAMSDTNILEITGESNDVLRVIGAVNTNTILVDNGMRYQVWSFGNTTLHIEENTVQVITA